jgi:hypothetical protein
MLACPLRLWPVPSVADNPGRAADSRREEPFRHFDPKILAIGFSASPFQSLLVGADSDIASEAQIMTDPRSPKEESGSELRFAQQYNTSYSGWSSTVATVIAIIIVGIVFYAIHFGR